MPSDYISKSALKRFIQENGYVYANTLDTFPTLDLVPAPVKCGECTGWEKQGRKIHGCDICRMFGFISSDFCSYGKRKEQK